MSNTENQPKKISLQDAIKQQLANKKAKQGNNNSKESWSSNNQSMKSQNTKKVNNQRKRQGV